MGKTAVAISSWSSAICSAGPPKNGAIYVVEYAHKNASILYDRELYFSRISRLIFLSPPLVLFDVLAVAVCASERLLRFTSLEPACPFPRGGAVGSHIPSAEPYAGGRTKALYRTIGLCSYV